MHLDHSVIPMQIFMRLEFGAGEIMEDEFFCRLALLGVDLDQHDEIAGEDLAVVTQLAKQFPVRIKSIGTGTQSDFWLVAHLSLEIVHASLR